jgi:hypothetical protein
MNPNYAVPIMEPFLFEMEIFSVHFLRHHLHFARAQNNTLVIFRPEKCFQLENQHTLHPQKYVKTNYL